MYYITKPATAATPSHEQNMKLFQALETAQCRIHELKANADSPAGELSHWVEVARKVREDLIMANQGLLALIANRVGNFGLDTEDLISAGQVGLMTAINKFDCNRGCLFSTYAYQWIKQAMTRACYKYGRTIRISEQCYTENRKLKEAQDCLRQDLGAEPTEEEIAWAMGISTLKVRDLLASDKQAVSLDIVLGDEDDSTYLDLIPDTSADDPSEAADRVIKLGLIEEAVETLVGLEREVFLKFKDGHHLSLEETGKIFHLSGERIRQIQHAAFQKVRAYVWAKDGGGSVDGIEPIIEKSKKAQLTSVVEQKVPSPVMKSKAYVLKMRAVEKNPNHHIWNNNGTWYCKFVLILANGERSTISNSLDTKDVELARHKRDVLIRLYNDHCSDSAA